MSEQETGKRIVPEDQTAGHETDSSKTDQHPPRPGRSDYNEGATETNVAGQGADQLTDADRKRLDKSNEGQ